MGLGFARQECWSGLPFPFPGDLSDPGIEPMSPALAGRFFTTEPPERSPYKPLGNTKYQLILIKMNGRLRCYYFLNAFILFI